MSALYAILSRLIAEEIKDYLPSVASWITKAAVGALPSEHQERMDEEWHSHLDEVPGRLAKVWVACGFYLAARKLSRRRLQLSSRLLASILLLFYTPLIFTIAAIFWLYSSRLAVHTRRVERADGTLFPVSTFWPEQPISVEFHLHLSLRLGLPGYHFCPQYIRCHYTTWRNSRLDDFEELLDKLGVSYIPMLIDAARGELSIKELAFFYGR